jgi:predicted ribosome quality control (RQC) complex YloA/Tae2 family protein
MKTYESCDSITIRVGDSAKENDELTNTSDPKYWWMHVSGYPGAHVIICHDGEVLPKETKRDAALLAVHHSKTPNMKMIWVDMTRVENVSSMKQKQHGRVTLNGKIDQLTVFVNREKPRLDRLLKKKYTTITG